MSILSRRVFVLVPGLALLLSSGGPRRAWAEESWEAITVSGHVVGPGSKARFTPSRDRDFESGYFDLPIFTARGVRSGPTACVTAGIHGDEINGYESARRAFARIDAHQLSGTVLMLPAVNIHGFRSGQRYLSDRRDLNRYFPGTLHGSIASYLAYAIFNRLVKRCSFLIDLHTASLHRDNIPQIRVDREHAPSLELARQFGLGTIIAGKGPSGSLRRETVEAGIPAIIYEAGEPHRFDDEAIEAGAEGVLNVLVHREMIPGRARLHPKVRIFSDTRWVRTPTNGGGFFFPKAPLGARVQKEQVLGYIVEPFSDARTEIRSPAAGEVIGRAYAQPVLSGYALFHIGAPE